MGFNEHPQYKNFINDINNLLKPIDEILETYRDNWIDGLITFDFEWFENVNLAINSALEIIEKNIVNQQNRFDRFLEAANSLSSKNKFFDFDSDEYEVDFILDIQKPMLTKKQELIKIREHIELVLT